MVTDRVGPTITTLKAEVDYLGSEVNKLLTLLADARTESMRLRAALGDALSYSTVGDMPVTIYENARAALEEGRT